MPDLDFSVEGAEAMPYCVTPTLAFRLRIANQGEEQIQSISLHAQIRIEAQRRRYQAGEKERLFDLFGEPSRWSQTVRSLLWTHASVNVPSFAGSIEVDLPVPCTYDFNVLAARYFHALGEEPVPVTLLFSGSIFHREEAGLRVTPISWSKEASYRFPVRAWTQMMDLYYPNAAWLCLPKETFDRLAAYKSELGLATWEQVLDKLLPERTETMSR